MSNMFFLLKNCEKVVCGTTVNSRFAPFNAENDWIIVLKRWYRNVEYLSRVIVQNVTILGGRGGKGHAWGVKPDHLCRL